MDSVLIRTERGTDIGTISVDGDQVFWSVPELASVAKGTAMRVGVENVVKELAAWNNGYWHGVEVVEKALPREETCKYGKHPASKRIIHSEGRAYIPVCDDHMGNGRKDAAACVPFGAPDPSNIDRIDTIGKTRKGTLDWSPKENWVDRAGGLPKYIEEIALALIRDHGMDRSRAIAVAISRCKLWAAGGGGVNADTRAKAAKAIAQWEKMKAKH